jgi:hypothetical protein
MSKTKAPDTGSVHLYPDPYHFIDGEPHAERDVTPEEAERLLAYQPAAFHTEAPALSGPLTTAPDEAAASSPAQSED